MKEGKSYQDLLVWQKSVELTTDVYKTTKEFPDEERFSLIQQVKRSAVSVPSNIAEGWGRNTDKSFGHFLSIAKGSLYELQTQLIIANKLEYINDQTLNELDSKIVEISKMTSSLLKKLN
ncbi:MAG: four helix bundle protein [Flavobacteriales bacterium]|nr:four helix bundle protein [Flavobacteriales bacterium]MCB9196271.1 four helix bundle protein [Flavobacteriales bacterium]MCB9198832.1 four helix bundle protein [Flavobacteriales bacterium]